MIKLPNSTIWFNSDYEFLLEHYRTIPLDTLSNELGKAQNDILCKLCYELKPTLSDETIRDILVDKYENGLSNNELEVKYWYLTYNQIHYIIWPSTRAKRIHKIREEIILHTNNPAKVNNNVTKNK